MYLSSLRADVSQGDLFDTLVYRYVYQRSDAPEPEIMAREIKAILLTADCEYDKPAASFVYVGEVRPMSEISPSTVGNVRARKTYYTFPLAAHGAVLEESYVDFRRILRFDKKLIAASASEGHRVLALDETARLAMQEQLSLFFGLEREKKSTQEADGG